jgi:hypothetical protein
MAALAASAVVALAAGGVLLAGGVGPDRLTPAPSASELVPLEVPELELPMDTRTAIGDWTSAHFTIFRGGDVETTYRYKSLEGVTLAVMSKKPKRPVTPGIEPPKQDEQISVGGQTATLRVHRHERRAEIFWQLSSGKWLVVTSGTAKRSKQVASARLSAGAQTNVKSPLDVALAPRGYEFESVMWTDPAESHRPSMELCRSSSNEDCYFVRPHSPGSDGPIADGPEPPDSGVCRVRVNDPPRALPFGKHRTVDGSNVRLSSDGCLAVKYFSGGRTMMVSAPDNSQLDPDDFARMAASITLR